MSNITQYGVEGGSVHIECISFSVPKPDLVIWNFAGNEIDSFNNHVSFSKSVDIEVLNTNISQTADVFFVQDYVFLEESLADGLTKSTLVIRKSEAKHFGPYNCTASNAYGSDSAEIILIPDSEYLTNSTHYLFFDI